MAETVKLKITTLTPVTIGSGAELSPYSDYVINGGQVCFIDKTKMVDKIIAKGETYFDKYVQGVAMGMDNNRSAFDLKTFLLNNKIVGDISEVVSFRCPLVGNPKSKLPIKGLLKSPLQEPYFAGSSIKGALKTVLMYNWLKTDLSATVKIEEVLKGKEVDGRHKDVNFDWLEKKFECFVNKQNVLIRPNTIQQVTDSSRIAKKNIIVVDCYRKMPIRFECIAKDKTAEFELTLENYKWEDLAKQANDYAFDCISRELDIVEKDDKLTNYFNYLVGIQEDYINEADNNIAYIRIGFGKGYYLNSLGIAIYDYVSQKGNEKLYDYFEKFIRKQFPKSNQRGDLRLKDFPQTRLFVTKTQEPLGWIKIEKI